MKHLITGATGRVGRSVISELTGQGHQVRGITRNSENGKKIEAAGAEAVVTTLDNQDAMSEAFKGVDTFFAITPEDPTVKDIPTEIDGILSVYRKAARSAKIRRVVGLSSMGAEHEFGTGNLKMSYKLEHTFRGLPIDQVFIRPGYYLSNWLMWYESAKERGELATFFPPDLKLAMVAPEAVGKLAASLLKSKSVGGLIYQLEGPSWYSSNDIAAAFSQIAGKKIRAVQTPRSAWEGMLEGAGFSKSGVEHFVEMTEAVLDGRTMPRPGNHILVKSDITPMQYFSEQLEA